MRAVHKRNFGPLADGTNIAINVQVASNAETTTGYIIKQRSNTKFLVNDDKAGTKVTIAGAGTGNVSVCKLVDSVDGSLNANEMSIMGQLATGGQVTIKKLYNKHCKDFNNVRYRWAIQNDSTTSLFILTAI